jgi:hypothetical protein
VQAGSSTPIGRLSHNQLHILIALQRRFGRNCHYISVFSFVGANIIAYVGWTRIRPQSDHCNAQTWGV